MTVHSCRPPDGPRKLHALFATYLMDFQVEPQSYLCIMGFCQRGPISSSSRRISPLKLNHSLVEEHQHSIWRKHEPFLEKVYESGFGPIHGISADSERRRADPRDTGNSSDRRLF